MNKLYAILFMSFSLIGMEEKSNSKLPIQEPAQKAQEVKKRERKRKADVAIVPAVQATKDAQWEKEFESLKKELATKNLHMERLGTSFGNLVTVLNDVSVKQNAQIDAILAFGKHLKRIDEQLLQLQQEVKSHKSETKKEMDDYTKFVMNTTITAVKPLINLVHTGFNTNTQSQREDRSKYCQEIISQMNGFKRSITSIIEGLQRIESQTKPAIQLSAEDILNSFPSLEQNREEEWADL